MTKTESKETQLKQLAEQIVESKICPELAVTATQLVFSDGSANSKVVFIGEAPGKEEDIQGKPFVGAAGKFLNQMIESLGWKRQDIYITNIIKYRPANNRDPLPEEVEAFMPYLFKQIAIVKPKLIVPLGRYAMSVFLPNLRISVCHGQPKRVGIKNWGLETRDEKSIRSLVVLPLYHPAAALYNGSLRKVLEADFAKIPRILSQI